MLLATFVDRRFGLPVLRRGDYAAAKRKADSRGVARCGRHGAMSDLFTALALVLVIEGLFLAIFPHRLRQIVAMMNELPPETLRTGGLVAAGLGVLLVWLLRG